MCATRLVPLGLAVGASMEGFMYATGFWAVALRKERERRDAAAAEAAANAATGPSERPPAPTLLR